MKIVKLAGGGVPPGFRKIKVTIMPNGELKREIVRGGQSKCSEKDAGLLSDLFNTSIPGYAGAFGTVDGKGHTAEYWEQVRTKPAVPVTPEKEDGGYTPPPQQEEERLRQEGYGV